MNTDRLNTEEQEQLRAVLNELREPCLKKGRDPGLIMVALCQTLGYMLAYADRDLDKDRAYSYIVEDVDLAYDIALSVLASAEALDKMKGKSTGVKGDSDA